MKKKILLASIVALSLALLVAVGGSIAWLFQSTETITNTFTVGDLGITLTETPNNGTTWSAQMIPGKVYSKDPVVTVLRPETNVDIYLYVKFEEKNNSNTYINYVSTLTQDNGWTQGDGTNIPSDVWYRTVKATDTIVSWNLLEGNTITINGETVQKDTFDGVTALPELVYTAYAIQTEGFTEITGWQKVSAVNP